MKKLGWAQVALLIGFSSLMLSCAGTNTVSRSNYERAIQIQYGIVDSMEEVHLRSNVGKGVATGGIIGALVGDGAGYHLAGAGIGAAVGGLLSKISEGSSKATGFTIQLNSGSAIKVISDDKHVSVGDCVAVEQGATTNIRHVSESLCSPDAHPSLHATMIERHQEDAAECHEAKVNLLKARTDQELKLATAKVKALCER
jgi:outer membrane lipoprotein SlyB